MSKRMMHNIIAVIIILCVIVFFRLYEPPHKENSFENQSDTTLLLKQNDSIDDSVSQERYAVNPNTASLEELLHAGFTKQQAYTCIKYRNSGGEFRFKNDIAKLYTVSEEDYEDLKDYIDLPEKTKQTKENKFEQKKYEKSSKSERNQYATKKYEAKSIEKQDLNTIDSVALTKIPFIGAFRAKKILEARQKWGGFYAMSQLEKLYSFDSIACANVEKYCYINRANIQKINLNTCSFKEVQQLPESSYYIAKNIFDYKKIVGTIEKSEDLVSSNIITKEKFEILQYYITTNDE